jgi:hypothetical protein
MGRIMRMLKCAGVVLSVALAGWSGIGSAHGAEADEEGRYVVVKNIFDCSPKTLKGDQTLVITQVPQQGLELAIRRLRGNVWYYLVQNGFIGDEKFKPLMSSEEFAAARRVEIPAMITAYRSGPNGPLERVFSKPGRYILYTSDTLESERGGYICTVDYVK